MHAGDYIGRVPLGVTIGAAGSQSFVWPDGRPDGIYTADAGADGAVGLTVTTPDENTVTVTWAGTESRRMIGHPWRLLRDGTWLFGDLYVIEAEPSDEDPTEWTVVDGNIEVRVAMIEPTGASAAGLAGAVTVTAVDGVADVAAAVAAGAASVFIGGAKPATVVLPPASSTEGAPFALWSATDLSFGVSWQAGEVADGVSLVGAVDLGGAFGWWMTPVEIGAVFWLGHPVAPGSGGGGAVDSVNGETGVVVLTAADVGADPAGSAADAITALGVGSPNGVAELDGAGLVPTSQLPSFVDDVIEAANFAALPGTGETGKIYVTLDDGKTFRWSGSAYVEISASLALGETSGTAYRGDRGKTAYDHSQIVTGNPHGTAVADVTGLTAALATKVPTSRTINGQPLTSDVTVSPAATGFFGTGADGAVTISADTTVVSNATNGFKHYTDLTVNAGVTLTVVGIVFVSGTLTVNGTIAADGGSSSGTSGGTGAGGPGASTGSLIGTGGAGSLTTGSVGLPYTNPTSGLSIYGGGAGGAGGTGSSGAGGASGTAYTPASLFLEDGMLSLPAMWMSGLALSRNAVLTMATGAGRGGGGGGGDGSNIGGGGGGGGGFLVIIARHVAGTGTVRANGGAGASRAVGNVAGGGGGGGGFVGLVTGDSSHGFTLQVNGGAGGTGNGTGGTGSAGSSGHTRVIVGTT